MKKIKLTQYSRGAGCGCKIDPALLNEILPPVVKNNSWTSLLVGNETRDDAAVYKTQNDTCIVSTVDFFTPIVDDPFLYGSIASVNAISDIYAMGGNPIMAVAILGWPVEKIPSKIAKSVLQGSQATCRRATIPLGGGHSVAISEPIFGLAVTGTVQQECLKRNSTAKLNSLVYLTKPLGIGIVTTAHKKGIAKSDHMKVAVETMLQLNHQGMEWSNYPYVNAMTDVTGFGLLGHLKEMCDGSHLSVEIEFDKIPRFDFLDEYLRKETIPGGTYRNWESFGEHIDIKDDNQKLILSDPQTSGGLLVSVDEAHAQEFERQLLKHKLPCRAFGKFVKRRDKIIVVK